MKTYQPKQKDVKRNWYLIDAKGEILGRMARLRVFKDSENPYMDKFKNEK